MPRILRDLGFATERARYLAEHIVVDPSRGAGHALRRAARAATRPTCARASARTAWTTRATTSPSTSWATTSSRCSRSTTSTTRCSQGVPNTAFTEALAFVFQARDLELLGLPSRTRRASAAPSLDDFWATLRDRRRRAGGHARVALDVRPPRARRRRELREATVGDRAATSGTATTRRCSAEGRRAARRLLAHDQSLRSTCPTTRSAN